MNNNKIKNLLEKRLNRLNLNKIAQSSYICHVANNIGKKYDFKAISFTHGVLKISIENHFICQQISFKKNEIINLINKKLKNNSVKKIIFDVGVVN